MLKELGKLQTPLKTKGRGGAQHPGGKREWIHPLVALFKASISDKRNFIGAHYLC